MDARIKSGHDERLPLLPRRRVDFLKFRNHPVGHQSLQNLLPCRWPEESSAQLPPNGAADGNAGAKAPGPKVRGFIGLIAIDRCRRAGS
jgi:hypothetical protein